MVIYWCYSMLEFRAKKRRFICKQCGRKAFDQGQQGKEQKQEGVEYEFLDLCTRCFKEYRKMLNQSYILIGLIQAGKVTQEEMQKLMKMQVEGMKDEAKKFRNTLLKRNELKSGWSKEKKVKLIRDLKIKTLKNKGMLI